MSRKDKRAGAKGRRVYRDHPSFALLPAEVLTSESCRCVPHYTFRTLAALAAAYHGGNNGDLSITMKRARDHGLREWQLYASLELLQKTGLIAKTRQGGKHPAGCSLYALEWRPIDESNKYDPGISQTLNPRNPWVHWKPPLTWKADIKAVEDQMRGKGSRERSRIRLRANRPTLLASVHSQREGLVDSLTVGNVTMIPVPPCVETHTPEPVPPSVQTSKILARGQDFLMTGSPT
jgi:hypothetical protein